MNHYTSFSSSMLPTMSQTMNLQSSPYKQTPLSQSAYIIKSVQNGSQSESKTMKYPGGTLAIDLEPISTRNFIPSSIGYDWSTRTDKLAYIPEIRRFSAGSAPVSMYLVLGCILVEHFIANDKSTVNKEIIGTLKTLQGSSLLDKKQKGAFLEAEADFKTIIDQIQRLKVTERNSDSVLKRKILCKDFYESFATQPRYAKAIGAAVHAVLINFLMKHPTNIDPKVKEMMLKEADWTNDNYIKYLCQLFSTVFQAKLDFWEIHNMTGRISKTEFFPSSDSYSFEVILLNISDKEKEYKQYKAFAFPIQPQDGYQQASIQTSKDYSAQKQPQEETNQQLDFVPQQEEKSFNDPQISTSKHSMDQYIEPEPQTQTKPVTQEISTSKEMVNEDQLAECSLCYAPLRSCDMFINALCGHRYCRYCIEDSRYIGTFCRFSGCFQYLDTEGLQTFISMGKMDVEEVPQQNVNNTSPKTESVKSSPSKKQIEYALCTVCYSRKEVSKMYANPCGHLYCVDCVQANIDSGRKYCLSRACSKLIDTTAMNAFVEQLIADEMRVMSVTCKSCNTENVFEYQKTAKPDYFKCSECKLVSCFKHADVMAKCLCICDTCLNSLELNLDTLAKSCRKCGKGYCTVCGERQEKVGPRCDCICGLCFGKKGSKSDKICQTCLAKPVICPECYDVMDESNEFTMACGHSICLTCQQMTNENESNIAFSCPVCSALNEK